MLGTFSLHKIDHAIRDLEQKVAQRRGNQPRGACERTADYEASSR